MSCSARSWNGAPAAAPPTMVSSGWQVAVEALHREKLLQPVQSPTTAELMPQALQPHGEYVGIDLNMIIAAYNTSLVKPGEVPKSYEDLKAPRWKGRLGIEADDVDWFAAVVSRIGEPGLGMFREIARTNGLALRKGHTLLANLVAAGEVPLALTVYRYKPEQLKAPPVRRSSRFICRRWPRSLSKVSRSPAVRRILTPPCCFTNSCCATGRRFMPSAT